jgi:hypothetical protein
LRSVHRDGIDHLKGKKEIYLHHTKPQNLLLTTQRSKFIDDFVALILFLADGKGNVGFMRRNPVGPIHRGLGGTTMSTGPPQQVLDFNEGGDQWDYEP